MSTISTISTDLQRRFDKAKSLLILDNPFFGGAVAQRDIIWDSAIKTASMSPRGQMRISPEFADKLTVKQLQFLLAHEAMHYMLGHSLRRKHRNARGWNIAADKVINDLLDDAGIGEFIEGGATMRGARNYAAEELYDENDGDGDGDGLGGTGDDVEDLGDIDPSEAHTIEAHTAVETMQLAKAAKAMGKLPAGMERIIDELVAINTPWHEILAQYLTRKVRDGASWRRPNRRFVAHGMYLPGTDHSPKMGEVVIGVDTSGSIGEGELNEFNGHINRILEMCGPEKVHVVYCDSEVNHTDTYEPEDFPVTLKPHGGGGTSFAPVFNWVAQQGLDPECVVYLTDGYGDQNYITQPEYPVVWLTTASTDFNFGTVVPFVKE